MIDLHTHSIFSDGELVPAEHVRRVEVMGYEAIAITDHADSSNIDFIVPRILAAARDLNRYCRTRLLAGIELTHVPPEMFGELVAEARKLGAQVVVGHGETVAEPVRRGHQPCRHYGRGRSSGPSGIHQRRGRRGWLRKKGFFWSCQEEKATASTNGHVARMAEKTGAMLAVCADAHGPGGFSFRGRAARKVGLGGRSRRATL